MTYSIRYQRLETGSEEAWRFLKLQASSMFYKQADMNPNRFPGSKPP
jgi:hypothetical protein